MVSPGRSLCSWGCSPARDVGPSCVLSLYFRDVTVHIEKTFPPARSALNRDPDQWGHLVLDLTLGNPEQDLITSPGLRPAFSGTGESLTNRAARGRWDKRCQASDPQTQLDGVRGGELELGVQPCFFSSSPVILLPLPLGPPRPSGLAVPHSRGPYLEGIF